MPQLRDFLSRFRPAGAPGAGRAAIPADRHLQLEAELDPVLRLLDGSAAESAHIIAAARHEADQLVAAARAEAAAMARDAQQRAAAIRRDSMREALAAARAEAAGITARAARQAALAGELARQRLPALTRRAVALIRDLPHDGQRNRAAGGDSPRSTPGWTP